MIQDVKNDPSSKYPVYHIMARGNQSANTVGNGPKTHSVGPKADQTTPEGLE